MKALLFAAALCLALVASPAMGANCQICHGKPDFGRALDSGRTQSLFVDPAALAASVHAGKACGDCHSDITEIPHPAHTRRVECSHCHFEQNTVGAPRSAGYKQYQESVHGRAAAAGNPKAPGCQDCHGSHQIGSHQDSTSQVSRANVSRTCGRCHLEIYAAFQTSIHGTELQQGNPDVPTCTGCHSEHNIRAHDDPASQTNAENIAATCSVCHAAEGLMGKYGIDQAQVDTYTKSFHGIAIRFGMRTVANCASCHGVHDIRPPEDPASSVHLDNIPETCGKCHPGANVNYAQGKIHVKPQDPESGIVYYVSSFFKYLTISVICGLVAHILLDLFRQFRRRQAEK